MRSSDADEVGLGAPGQLQDQRDGVEPGDDHVDGAEEVRADPVHLVDEAHPRHGVLVRLPPDVLRLRLDAGDRVVDRDRAVEDAQGPLDLDGEVDVAGRVDDVDGVVAPGGLRRGGRDRDAALLLLLHPVHRRGAFVHLADLVVDPRVVQDPLGRGGLARVDMSHDPDVAGRGERVLDGGSHCDSSLFVSGGGTRRQRRCVPPATSGSGRRPCCSRPSCGCPRGASRWPRGRCSHRAARS